MAPASGLTVGGAQVSVIGTGFAENATVTFGGVPATGVVMSSTGLLRVIAPAHGAGAVEVVVTNDDGQLATLSGAFTYLEPPNGETGRVADGGDGALEDPAIDAGSGTGPPPTGCGCGAGSGSLALALVGLLALRRRRRC